MRRVLLAACCLALLSAPLMSAPATADLADDPELTLGEYRALPEAERSAYIAGLADALDAAAAMGKNDRLSIIAACTHGFEREVLREAVEAGPPGPRLEWPDDTAAAAWFIASMIGVCQLQLPPE